MLSSFKSKAVEQDRSTAANADELLETADGRCSEPNTGVRLAAAGIDTLCLVRINSRADSIRSTC